MIQLKGKRAGMLQCIVPDDIGDDEMLAGLGELASAGMKLLRGSDIVMDMKGRPVGLDLIGKICGVFFEPAGCRAASWIVLDASSQETLKKIGLPLGEPKAAAKGRTSASGAPGLLFTGTLRGGQKIEHAGDVIVAGHANTGSEILAEGHVVVLGWLKGLVHAGCGGDNNMSVSARSLESGQVRIGNKVGLIDRQSPFWGRPSIVTASDEEVLIAEWPAI